VVTMRVTALLPTMASNTLLSGTGQAWFVTKLAFRSKVYCFRTKSLESTRESNSDASRSNYAGSFLLLAVMAIGWTMVMVISSSVYSKAP
jgi:hypothetical protein